ncbi:hypothetical protein [Spirosoma luteum]|uniref:hypothetical protein n=1 Tax=Spirosoma luteum TaxID=431553 RepID=UPI0003811943|nr:hypothetical protein [Spirosoma luteum]
MKTETPKPTQQKELPITVNPRLDELFEGKVIFPKKLEQANEFLAKHPFPEHLKEKKP